MHKGDLEASDWMGDATPYGFSETTVARDHGGSLEDLIVADDRHEPGKLSPARLAQWLTRGSWGSSFYPWDERFQPWQIADERARSTQFEQGK